MIGIGTMTEGSLTTETGMIGVGTMIEGNPITEAGMMEKGFAISTIATGIIFMTIIRGSIGEATVRPVL